MKKFAMPMVALMMFSAVATSFAEKYSSKSHSMMINGTSTLHDWKTPVKTVSAQGDITLSNTDLQTISSLYFEAISKSIKSEKESMDEKIYDALKADSYDKITYKLTKVNSIKKVGNEFEINSSGQLSIAGSTQQCDMIVKAKVLPTGEIQFDGSKDIKLSQFGIERPSAMLGTIKCGDDLKITFSLVMKKG